MHMYDALASWWTVVSPPEHYEEEATQYIAMIRGAPGGGAVRELLELGSGGGHNASYLKRAFAMTLVEPSPAMRLASERLNPECAHVEGDMRNVRLGRTFDAVFVHDAVCYMTTEPELRAAIETIAVHLPPGGIAVVAPDETAETFDPGAELHEGDDPITGRSVRYLEWALPPAPGETACDTHYSFLLREADGAVRAVHDVHRVGVFPRATWLRLFDEAGLDVAIAIRTCEGVGYETFVAAKRIAPPL